MKDTIFKGMATALITPMDEFGNIDFKALERLLKFQLDNGADALLVNGTTGESAALEDWEKLALAEYVIRYTNGKVPVIVGTGSNNTFHSKCLSKEAQALGADALLLVTPYYNKTSQEGLVKHFTEIADQVSIPVIVYNVPGRTGVDIAPETYERLAGHPNIIGIKEAGGNISKIAKTMALCGGCLDLYSGNDDQTLPILSLGGKGVISVAGNLIPREMGEICRAFFRGDIEESRRLQLEMLDLMTLLFCDVNPIPVKAAFEMMGMGTGTLRLPLVPLAEEKRRELAGIMKKHGLLQG